MNETQSEKVALVTGASKGIGQAICAELAQSGYRIVV
ncbi:MAG: SDR family oxidoreductase, partial [Desulfobacterales bacterium]